MSELTDPHAEAEKVRKAYARSRDSIMQDSSLSDSGKREKLNALRAESQARLDTLRVLAKAADASDAERDFHKAFGASRGGASEMLSFRDALARTKGMKADELAQTIREARRFGDDDLARAAGYRAYEAGPGGNAALHVYLDGDDDRTAAVQRMIDRQKRLPEAFEGMFFRLPG